MELNQKIAPYAKAVRFGKCSLKKKLNLYQEFKIMFHLAILLKSPNENFSELTS